VGRLFSFRAALAGADETAMNANLFFRRVVLDRDHPGFHDPAYRARRDAIACIADDHASGEPVPAAPYTGEEHAVWRDIWTRLRPLHLARACAPIVELQERLALHLGAIPQLAEINAKLREATGFRMEPVAGLVPPRRFLEPLADGVFRSTQYVRHASRPDYTPEPDVVHELVGHAASLMGPELAELNRAFGRAAREADKCELARIERAYWFTLEFGAVRETGTIKAIGAGLLSSVAELGGMLDGPELCPLDLDVAANTDYETTRTQDRLFVAESFDAMLAQLRAWLEDGGWRQGHGTIGQADSDGSGDAETGPVTSS
jgi:phenylalanine-4-hydroxylase